MAGRLNGEIEGKVRDYLLDTQGRTSELYLLPKIHKPNVNPGNIPTRPIISANGSPTEKKSEFVDHFLNPTTFSLPSYIKDTTHLLQKLNNIGTLPDNAILATLDVESLYTNIPNTYGIRAAKIKIAQTRPHPNVKPSNKSLITLLEMVLTKNNFQFNGHHILQKSGTAMGTKLAVGYANNTLGKFEDDHVYTYKTQNFTYYRFIDDIFLIWFGSEETLLDFIQHLNSSTTFFKFTHETSTTSVNFLDVTISIKNNKIETDLYCKPTDSHNYLYYNSAHPQKCKDSIPYSQFLRIKRICSKETDFLTHCLNYCRHFIRRGYPGTLLEEAINLANQKDRNNLLNPTPKEKQNNREFWLLHVAASRTR